MTTIATDGYTVACDGFVSTGNTIVQTDKQKIIRVKGVSMQDGDALMYVCFAGNVSDFDYVLRRISEGTILEADDLNSTTLLITQSGTVYENHTPKGNRIHVNTAKYIAIGSGADFALSAMELGYSPVEAVRHACKMDVYSGGKIRSYKIREESYKPLAPKEEGQNN
jgi:ATP-dependent protease HslVU (ClpYQ) peptidase subunit